MHDFLSHPPTWCLSLNTNARKKIRDFLGSFSRKKSILLRYVGNHNKKTRFLMIEKLMIGNNDGLFRKYISK